MTRFHEKAQGHTKQIVGQMIGDEQLVREGKQQAGDPGSESVAHHSDHGIIKDEKAEEQPRDKERVETVHKTDGDHAVVREQTRKPKLRDADKASSKGE